MFEYHRCDGYWWLSLTTTCHVPVLVIIYLKHYLYACTSLPFPLETSTFVLESNLLVSFKNVIWASSYSCHSCLAWLRFFVPSINYPICTITSCVFSCHSTQPTAKHIPRQHTPPGLEIVTHRSSSISLQVAIRVHRRQSHY